MTEGHSTYSSTCLKRMFKGKKVSHILSYDSPALSDEAAIAFIENRKRISISGVQEKLSLLLVKNELRLTKEGEQGTYILKPIPRDLLNINQVPANEHLTMQIAKQVYGLHTAENALIFFRDGSPAYITLRFDMKADGVKWGKEDFASLAGKTRDTAGPDFKYDFSYEEAGLLIQQYVPAWQVEIEKYFCLVVFNYLFSNGHAHLKNFSLLESKNGDYFLSPAYDLLHTGLHVKDTAIAANKGLFEENLRSLTYQKNGQPSGTDFILLAKRIGIKENRIEKLMHPFLEKQSFVETLIQRSYLDDSSKKSYLISYHTKRNILIS